VDTQQQKKDQGRAHAFRKEEEKVMTQVKLDDLR
jgi:hypothetical protein